MANHTIAVSLQDGRVFADPNPLPDDPSIIVGPGDTVTWTFDETVDGDLDIGFTEALALPIGPQPQRQPVGPMGPFITLFRTADNIIGTIGPGAPPESEQLWRYLYKIFRNGVALDWVNPAPGAPDLINGGGIDTPRRPPT